MAVLEKKPGFVFISMEMSARLYITTMQGSEYCVLLSHSSTAIAMIQVILGAELGLLLADNASFLNSDELHSEPAPTLLHCALQTAKQLNDAKQLAHEMREPELHGLLRICATLAVGSLKV